MYCQKCSAENPDDAHRCLSCGYEFAHVSAAAPVAAKTSRAAIAALVLGILAFITCGITAIPAIIYGIGALVKILRSNGMLKGKGMAITGLVLTVVFFIIATHIIIRVRGIAQRIVCCVNLKGLSTAMVVYANDYDDEVATADEWCDLLMRYADVSPKSFRCPAAPKGECNYALNKNFRKMGGPESAQIVVLFESRPGWNQAGGPELLTTEYHNGEGCNVAFSDGDMAFVRSDEIDDLYWGPEE